LREDFARNVVPRTSSPDGDTYGSRWSRAKRETTGIGWR